MAPPQVHYKKHYYFIVVILTQQITRQVMLNPTYQPSVQYLTLKGYQKGILGSVWTLVYPLSNISWFAPRSPDLSCIQVLNDELDTELLDLDPPYPDVLTLTNCCYPFLLIL
jgi:hypothetical protein